jgi:hypothetical protein
VMNFDGTMSRVLTTASQGSCFAPMALNADGSQLVSGALALLYPTAGGDPVSLLMSTGGWGGSALPIGTDAFDIGPAFSMSGDGRRFVYLNYDGLPAHPGTKQIALVDLNPTSVGAAPAVTGPTFSPASIPHDRSVSSTVNARISGGGTLVGAGNAVILGGVEDTAGSWVSGRLEMRDDGMMGDRTAADGVFTTRGGIHAGTGATVGPRVVRIKAESKAADGRRHATAIDVGGLQIR